MKDTPTHLNVPIARTTLTEDDKKCVEETLSSGWLVQGPKVAKFEEEWCRFTGAKHSIAVTSCTSALQLSLLASGFSAGDEAIVPAFTWVSSANVVEQCGGRVSLCDIELNTFNMDVKQIEGLITERTKAIIPVHLFGLSVNMEKVLKIAEKFSLLVIEDAACGFGSTFNGQHVGVLGHAGCFSFHPRKSITTGEGGMVTTNDSALAEKIRCLRDHGAVTSDRQRHLGPRPYLLSDHVEAGFNERMTDIQASLGLSQMGRANDILAERRHIASVYESQLSDIDWLGKPRVEHGYEHGFQSYPCLFQPQGLSISEVSQIRDQRNKFMEYLQENGVSTRPATHAVHMLQYYKQRYKFKPNDFPNAFLANDCSISLPLYNGMSKQEQEHVINCVRGYKP